MSHLSCPRISSSLPRSPPGLARGPCIREVPLAAPGLAPVPGGGGGTKSSWALGLETWLPRRRRPIFRPREAMAPARPRRGLGAAANAVLAGDRFGQPRPVRPPTTWAKCRLALCALATRKGSRCVRVLVADRVALRRHENGQLASCTASHGVADEVRGRGCQRRD